MSKHLRIWLFVLLGSILASSTLLAQGVITMTTSQAVEEEIGLEIEANGNVTIEGAQEAGQANEYGRRYYTIESQTITIRGDVTELNCSWNQLTSLDVSGSSSLRTLDCSYNQLTSLDVSKNTALTQLDCSKNQLSSLDLSQNAALATLWCSDNQLTNLDVSKNTALMTLNCFYNQLTSLDVSGCARLTLIGCYSNYINGKAMTKLVNSLSNRRGKSSGTIVIVDRSSEKRDENSCSTADVTTAKKKNWEVLK